MMPAEQSSHNSLLAVDDAVLAALEEKAIAGYTPGSTRPAYREDLEGEPLKLGSTVRVLAHPHTIDGRNWIDHPDKYQQEARVVGVTTPAHLSVDRLRSNTEIPNTWRGRQIPLPGGTQEIVAVDGELQVGAVSMVEISNVRDIAASE